MEFKKLVGARFSCKRYSDKMVDDSTLHSILDTARLAPTAKNLQEQHIYGRGQQKRWQQSTQ